MAGGCAGRGPARFRRVGLTPDAGRASRLDRGPRVVRALWIAGFAVGTVSHVLDLATAGLDVYAGHPLALRAFWVSLTALDPLVIALLARRRPAGVGLGVAVILADIAVNWTVIATAGGIPVWGAVNQTLFAILVLATAPALLRWTRRRDPDRPNAPPRPPGPGSPGVARRTTRPRRRGR